MLQSVSYNFINHNNNNAISELQFFCGLGLFISREQIPGLFEGLSIPPYCEYSRVIASMSQLHVSHPAEISR